MLLAHYYAVALAGALLTGAWLFRPRERTVVTSLGAFLSWALVALLGGDVETYAQSGATVETVNNTTLAVSQGDALVSAPVPDEIRLFAALWALLSGLTLILYTFGVYPPADDQPAESAGDR